MRASTSPLCPVIVSVFVAVLMAGCSTSESGSADEGRPEKVYTNEDLEDLPPASSVEQPAIATPPAEEQDAGPPIAADDRRVTEAQARVTELEKRLLAVRNPFLPRPVLPPEEAAAWEGLDGAQRAQRVEGQLEQARNELAAAKDELARLRSR